MRIRTRVTDLPNVMRRRPLSTVLSLVVGTTIAGLFGVQLAAASNLYAFEWAPLGILLGWQGWLFVAAANAGLVLSFWLCTRAWRGLPWPAHGLMTVGLLTWAAFLSWAAQYVLFENPPTVRLALRLHEAPEPTLRGSTADDFAQFSLVARARDEAALEQVEVLYERIRINSPEVFDLHPIAATIDKYAQRYDIDPLFLFFRAYLMSYYGEATSGPVPYLGMMTAETIRDIVQIHLPSWFVESSLRQRLVRSDILERAFPEPLGFKLRYAIHKATLDVSAQPYDLNTYSDTFLVLAEFPEEFPDVLGSDVSDPLRTNLQHSFRRLRGTALVTPYGEPYGAPVLPSGYYDQRRDDLKRFARAAYYLTALDFDFATRVQALLSAYQRGVYEDALGPERWAALPRWQQLAMLAMVRDLLTTNVGHLAYNLYALPELNCTPVEFVAEAARRDAALLSPDQQSLWRPENHEYLWAGAGYQLTVLNEVWSLVNPTPFPGASVNDTATNARRIVGHARG